MSEKQPTLDRINLLRTRSLTTAVQEEIERQILVGQLKSGERIRESHLAAKLGVSRGPIREACRSLEQLNLVQIIANRGVYVRRPTLEEALNAYDVRAALFGMAGKVLASKITNEQTETLLKIHEKADAALKAENYNQYYALNLTLHETLVSNAENTRLHEIYTGLVKELHLFRRSSLVSSIRMADSHFEHGAIIEALIAHDGNKVEQLMQNHVRAGKTHMLSLFKQATDNIKTGRN